MKELANLLGKTRAAVTKLFSSDSEGWNDVVELADYPSLSSLKEHMLSVTSLDETDFGEFHFEFPQSLDDFGLRQFFEDNYTGLYKDYIEQWTSSNENVKEQQLRIQNMYQDSCPKVSENCLYYLVGLVEGDERVMYVGKAERGLLMRFFNGPRISYHTNNYIGDCRSIESPKNPNYTWRAKSAELRRRGVHKVVWAEVPLSMLVSTEKEIIQKKLTEIEEGTGIRGVRDPVNT